MTKVEGSDTELFLASDQPIVPQYAEFVQVGRGGTEGELVSIVFGVLPFATPREIDLYNTKNRIHVVPVASVIVTMRFLEKVIETLQGAKAVIDKGTERQ